MLFVLVWDYRCLFNPFGILQSTLQYCPTVQLQLWETLRCSQGACVGLHSCVHADICMCLRSFVQVMSTCVTPCHHRTLLIHPCTFYPGTGMSPSPRSTSSHACAITNQNLFCRRAHCTGHSPWSHICSSLYVSAYLSVQASVSLLTKHRFIWN